MASPAQIEANRRNAQLSTGPHTPAGQARSSQNALKHGIRAQAILDAQFTLLGEDAEEFAALLQALVDDLQPLGPLEEMCVETIAPGLWRQRRVLRSEMGYIARRQHNLPPDDDNPIGQARVSLPDFDILDKLMRYEVHLTRQVQWGLNKLAQLQNLRYLQAKADSLDAERSAKRLREDALATVLTRYASRATSPRPSAGGPTPADQPAAPVVPPTPAPPSPAPASQPAPVLPNEPNSPPARPSQLPAAAPAGPSPVLAAASPPKGNGHAPAHSLPPHRRGPGRRPLPSPRRKGAGGEVRSPLLVGSSLSKSQKGQGQGTMGHRRAKVPTEVRPTGEWPSTHRNVMRNWHDMDTAASADGSG